MLTYLGNGWELSIDFAQWMIGFNYYNREHIFNIFLGPIRIGWWRGSKEFWEGE